MHRLAAMALLTVAATVSAADPTVVDPGGLSGMASEDCLSFTPDGDTAVYDLASGKNRFIVTSHRAHGAWSTPEIAPFSGQWKDHDPAISPDGSFVVYASDRPVTPGGAPQDDWGTLWRVERKGAGWSEPQLLPSTVNFSAHTYGPTIAADGSLYFIAPDSAGNLHIFRSQYRGGTYEKAVEQNIGNLAAEQKDPGIAPDESFVVFDSNDPAKNDADRLFIAFREGDHWGKAVDLGDAVNADNHPWGSHISADGRTLYYTSDRTVAVSYPRSREQAMADFQRLTSWDDGVRHVWALSLAPWIDSHGAKQ